VASPDEVLRAHGLDAESLAERISAFVEQGRRAMASAVTSKT